MKACRDMIEGGQTKTLLSSKILETPLVDTWPGIPPSAAILKNDIK